MFDRSHRFHGYNALNFAYREGKTVRGPQLGLKYALNPRRKSFRMAVVVSKKVSKSAVTRNRIRRRIFAVVQSHAAAIDKPYDLIFSVFSDQLATIDSAKLDSLIIGMLHKAGLATAVKPTDHGIVGTEGDTA